MRNIGRFIVVDLLGSGTQGKVYRCTDPRLEREVAIKLLHKPLLGGAQANDELMHEARSMSRLNHQNLVSVYDMGEQKDRPYVVFELIEGQTLADLLKREPLDATRVLEILDGILDGIAAAHEQDIVHRDIKPANIILTRSGVPKITDFGIAAVLRGEAGRQEALVGTPRYMAPEYIGQGRLMKQSDVFSLGLLAWEMLAGRPAYEGANAERLLHDILHRPVKPLDQVLPDIDERLQKIVDKALEKDPYLRFADAGEMRRALLEYRNSSESREVVAHSHSTVQFLIRRMRLKSDFPALSQTISTLNQLSASSNRDSSQLAAIIVKDQGLSSKILRVVNSAYYAAFSGNISTISRALVILGMNGVRSIAASLSLLEHFGGQPHLKELLSESLYSGLCAREICRGIDQRLGEEALLGTMLRRLGQTLVAYYLPEEEQEIQRLNDAGGQEDRMAEVQVLGADYAHIGREVAAEWNFPMEIRACMEDMAEMPKNRAQDPRQRLQLVACLADEATMVLRQRRSAESVRRVKKLVAGYSRVLGVEPMAIVDSIASAKREYLEFKVNFVTPGEKQRFVDSLDGDTPPPPKTVNNRKATAPQLGDSVIVHSAEKEATDRRMLLEQGLQKLTRRVGEGGDPRELTALALDVLYRGMGFKRVIAAEWDGRGKVIVGASGLGEDVDELLGRFRVRCAGRPDLLSIASIKNSDVYIQDATQESVTSRMPPWFAHTSPGSFLVLPMRSGSGPLGMLYAEYRLAYGFDEDPGVLRLVQALRDQLVLGLDSNQVAMAQ